jgi:hypothetical protein
MFSSTGFNAAKLTKADHTMHAVSNRYGKSTIVDTHPNIKASPYQPTSRAVYISPQKQSRPNWKVRQNSSDFADSSATNSRFRTKASGFVQNAALFDGTTWETEKNLHGNMQGSEYRKRFNQDKPFHKKDLK